MKEDFIVKDFNIPPHPKGVVLNGKTVRLEPLNVEKHSEDLFESNSLDVEEKNWAYLPYGPFDTLGSYQTWIDQRISHKFFEAVVPNLQSLLRYASEKNVESVGYASEDLRLYLLLIDGK